MPIKVLVPRHRYNQLLSEGMTGVFYGEGALKLGGPIDSFYEAQIGTCAGVHPVSLGLKHMARYGLSLSLSLSLCVCVCVRVSLSVSLSLTSLFGDSLRSHPRRADGQGHRSTAALRRAMAALYCAC